MPIIDADLTQKLQLDGTPNSLQRLEMALHARFQGYEQLAARPDDLASLIAYIQPVFHQYTGGQPVPGAPARLRYPSGEVIDLNSLLVEVFDKMNGMVLFHTCFNRLMCLPE